MKVRFLHVTERKVGRKDGEALEFVDELRVGEELYLPWDESTEREIAVGISDLLQSSKRVAIDIPGGSTRGAAGGLLLARSIGCTSP